MHRRLRAFGLVVLVVCGVAVAIGTMADHDAGLPLRRDAAVIAVRAAPAVMPVSTSRPTRERLSSLVAVLAALALATAAVRHADRPLHLPRRTAVVSTTAPSRAPPPPQNLAF